MAKNKIIALAGNPNCGKTVIFNALTGSRQQVGNWAGVTIEQKIGFFTVGSQTYEMVDLPGTYSLSVVEDCAIDERIACHYLLYHHPDLIINVVDASNLERHLYLTAQLLEMQIPLIIALNMTDIAKRRGIHINIQYLSRLLTCPIIPLIAIRDIGMTELRQALTIPLSIQSTLPYPFDPLLQNALETLKKTLPPTKYHLSGWRVGY